jgi:pimeloyl-ACP methyl ester carboxylesterase/sterol desaturase/sphingolipid hydroxylase (fatty acid hydroxylase superfamily)
MPTPLEILLDPVSLAVIGMYIALFLWEKIAPRHKNLPKVKYATLRGLIAFAVFFYLSSYLPLLTDEYLASFQFFNLGALPVFAQILIGLLIYQFMVYLWHSAMHKFDGLWRVFHQMHHSAERLDIPSAFYFSPMDMIGFTLLGSLVFALIIGVNPMAATVIILSLNFLSIFQHANIKTPQWLGYIIQRPEQHAVHHSRGVHRYNFSDFPIYDLIFGTFKNPETFTGEYGFYDGASGRVGDMLMFKDVHKPAENARLRKTPKVAGSLVLLIFSSFQLHSEPQIGDKLTIELSTGITMTYTDIGKPSGEVVMFLHGYTDTSRSFKEVIKEIAENDPTARIIAPDLRGHGESSVPEDGSYEISDFKEDVLALLNQLKIEKVHLIGHSLGSVVAQLLAVEHPDKVYDLVLIGTFVYGKENPVLNDFLMKQLLMEDWIPRLNEKYGPAGLDSLKFLAPVDLGMEVTAFLRNNWVTELRASDEFLNEVYEETIHIPLITWYAALEAQINVDHRNLLSQLRVPVLVIYGGDDEIFLADPDQDYVKASLRMARENHNTPVFYKTYKRLNDSQPKIGHNTHWGLSSHIALDIVEFSHFAQPVNTAENEFVSSEIELF